LKTYLFALAGFCSSLPATGFSIFGPLILKNLGYDEFEIFSLQSERLIPSSFFSFDVMLFMIPYGVLQLITLGVSFVRLADIIDIEVLTSSCSGHHGVSKTSP